MTIRALLLGGMSLALASAASAQSAGSPLPTPGPPATIASPSLANPPAAANAPAAQAGLPPQRIAAMVRARGFHPIGRPVLHGNLYVQHALDPDDMEYRIVVDSLTGRTLSVRPIRMAGPYAYGPGPYAPPPYRPARFYGPPPDDYGFGYGAPRPPRVVPTARLAPPQTQPAVQPQQHAQPGAAAPAPLPRPKPYVAEATGSIPIESSASPAPQKAPDPDKSPEPPKAAPQNVGAALPPVAPLD